MMLRHAAIRSRAPMVAMTLFGRSFGTKMTAAPMTYITGEEMSHYAAELVKTRWIEPHIDTTAWEYFDLSCNSRDDTNDQVLHDAVASGS